jgi:AraC-like DNA-binding protein
MSKGIKITLLCVAVALVGGAIWFFMRVRQRDEHLQVIPENAAAVMVLNVWSLFEKAEPDELKKLKFVDKQKKKSSNGDDKLMRDLMKNPMSAGIDVIQNVYGFAAPNGTNMIAGITLKINDDEAFKKFLEKMSIGDSPKRMVGFWFVKIDWNNAIAWNKEVAIIYTMGAGDLDQTAEKFLFRKEDESILSSASFQEFRTHGCDLGVYANNEVLNSMNEQMDRDVQQMQQTLQSDGYSEALLSFETNSIDLHINNHPKTERPAILRKDGPTEAHLQAVSQKQAVFYLGLAVNISGLIQLLDQSPATKESLDDMQRELGITREELKQQFSGDISMTFSDYKNLYTEDPNIQRDIDEIAKIYEGFNGRFSEAGSEEDYEFKREVVTPVLVLNIGLKDMVKTQAVLEKIGLKKDGDAWVAPGRGNYVYSAIKNNHLVITNDYPLAQTVGKTGILGAKLPQPIADNARKKPICGFFDLTSAHYPKLFIDEIGETMGELGAKLFFEYMRLFQHITIEGEGNNFRLQINLVSGERNSLFRLIKQADEVYVN